MHMIEDNPAPQLGGKATNLTVMDVMLKWADMNASKPEVTGIGREGPSRPGQERRSQASSGPGQKI